MPRYDSICPQHLLSSSCRMMWSCLDQSLGQRCVGRYQVEFASTSEELTASKSILVSNQIKSVHCDILHYIYLLYTIISSAAYTVYIYIHYACALISIQCTLPQKGPERAGGILDQLQLADIFRRYGMPYHWRAPARSTRSLFVPNCDLIATDVLEAEEELVISCTNGLSKIGIALMFLDAEVGNDRTKSRRREWRMPRICNPAFFCCRSVLLSSVEGV